jgi:hypothetical protein
VIEKITIQSQCWDGFRRSILFELNEEISFEMEPKEALKVEKFLGHLKRNKRAYLATAYFLALLTLPGGHFIAAGASGVGLSGGLNLILLLQKASFWIGMGITMWGLIEMGLDSPGWKGRVFKGILMYVGVLLVPLVFLELKDSLQVDVWEQIKNSSMKVSTP